MRKRIAGWLEKVGFVYIVIGMFQDKTQGLLLGASCLCLSLGLTWMEGRRHG